MDGLHGDAHISENPHLLSSEAKLGVLQIRHFDPDITNKIVVDNCRCRSGQVRRHQATKGTALYTKHKLLFFVGVFVAHGGLDS